MSTHNDPEGNESVLFDTSALSLIVPGDLKVFIYASFDSSWEQAVIFYANGERLEPQIGSFVMRPNSVIIPPQASQYELTMVGWHKRSNANPDLPWVASRGRRIGPVVFAWDDSADDEDYRDVRIKLVTG